jgi:serine protease
MKKIFIALAACFSLTTLNAQTVHTDCIDGQVYVKFFPAAIKQLAKDDPNNLHIEKIASLNALVNKYGFTSARKPFYQADDDAKLPYILQITFSKINKVDNLIEDLYAIPGVEYAEKVPAMHTFTTPNDPSYIAQNSAVMNQIMAPTAWDIFISNSNIPAVAIVDNAIQKTHVDLAANMYTNAIEAAGTAGVDDDANGYIDDIVGYDVADGDNNVMPPNNAMDHGTHCSGIAGARTNNGVGGGSIGWNIKIIPVKCTMNTTTTSAIDNGYGGIVYAAKAKARVISCSWGGSTGGQAGQDVVNYAWNKGCIIVAAAGNSGNQTLNYPGAYNNVYCVASVAANNVKSGFSQYGSVGNAWVDICAPGENIYSTLPTNSYGNLSGTSMATPMVAGLAGLMVSYVPLMTQQNVLNCISSSATSSIYTIPGNAAYVSGNKIGAGLINATGAMNCATGWLTAPPIANFFSLVRSTCPNTPLQFTDSTMYLYLPATWSWTFQSGTPATSTSSAPIVQWATPGTYSVGMTVTTPNGNNSITKLMYISVSNPIALPLNEGFQAATFLPTNWSPINIGNDNVYWTRTVSCGGFGTSTACALFDNAGLDAGGDRDEMRTPRYNCSNVVSAHLRFDVAYKVLNNIESDSLRVHVSSNCGTSWTNLYAKGGTVLATAPLTPTAYPLWVPLANEWRKDTIDVTAQVAGQPNVMFSFVNHGHYGQGTYLDNINLFFPAPAVNFTNSAAVCPGGTLTYTNNTLNAATYSWNFGGGSPATSTLQNPGSVTYTAGGIYTTTLTAWNGTSSTVFTKTVQINSTPVIAINNQTICAGGTATLNATGAATYTWNTGFVGNPLLVAPPSNTVYSVIGNSLGCTNTQTVSVTIGSQLSVFITPTSPTVCASGAATLTASGAVNYTWNTGSNLTAIVVSPTASTQYSIVGSNGACTGTVAMTLSVVATPSVTLGASPSSSICFGQTATLTASGQYTQFTWVTPTVVANSITVNPTSNTTYTVFAAGDNGCNTSSLVNVTIKPLPTGVITTTNASCGACPDGEAIIVASGVGPFTYQWLPAGGTQSYVAGFSPGCYTCMINSANGCQGSQTMCIGFGTGLQNKNTNFIGLNIFPNPATNMVMIDLQGRNFNVALYNNLGQLIVERNNNANMTYLQLNEISKGIYTIVVQDGDAIVRKKLVIQ